MSFRTKLLLVVLLTIFASVSMVAYAVTYYTQAAFEAMDTEHTEALVAQFKKEYDQRGEEIAHQAKNIAEGNFTEKMAIDLSRPNADQSLYVRDAVGSAQEHGLDYVEFVNYDGVLISSVPTTPSRARVCTSSGGTGWIRISLPHWFCPRGCGRSSIPTSSPPLFLRP